MNLKGVGEAAVLQVADAAVERSARREVQAAGDVQVVLLPERVELVLPLRTLRQELHLCKLHLWEIKLQVGEE